MTSSTSTSVLGNEVRDLLQAYNVHHSGSDEQQEEEGDHPELRQAPRIPLATLNVQPIQRSIPQGRRRPDLETRRRVPPYRQTHREHKLASRPASLDILEGVLIQAAFFGVYVHGVSESRTVVRTRRQPHVAVLIPAALQSLNQIWRKTGGKVNDTLFRFPVGGQW